MTSVYSSFASLLFLLCAAVQTNDPDPAFWILTYLIGGPGLSLLPRLVDHSVFARCVAIWIAALCALAAHLAAGLRLRMRDAAPADDDASWLWQALEHELGRELGGTIALILHAIVLRVLIGSGDKNGGSRSLVASGALAVGAALLIAVAFTWFQYQPAMVARYQSEAPHCSGALSQQ